MIKFQPVLIFLLFFACVFMYIRKPSGHDREVQRLERDIARRQRAIDSAYHVIRLSQQREIALKLRYNALEHSRQQAEQNTDKWRKRYEIEKNSRPVPYNDAELDSILSAWYGR